MRVYQFRHIRAGRHCSLGFPPVGEGGLCPDSEKSHAKFKQKYGLPFALLADPDHSLAEQYGFWVEKSFAGKKYMGIERSTVVIGPDGTVTRVFRRVKPDQHAAQVLAALVGPPVRTGLG